MEARALHAMAVVVAALQKLLLVALLMILQVLVLRLVVVVATAWVTPTPAPLAAFVVLWRRRALAVLGEAVPAVPVHPVRAWGGTRTNPRALSSLRGWLIAGGRALARVRGIPPWRRTCM